MVIKEMEKARRELKYPTIRRREAKTTGRRQEKVMTKEVASSVLARHLDASAFQESSINWESLADPEQTM